MQNNTFVIPSSVTPADFAICFKSYREWKYQIDHTKKEVCFDFKKSGYLEPIAMIFFASEEDYFKELGFDVHIDFTPDSRVGKFLKIFGIGLHESMIDFYEERMSEYAVKVHKCRSAKESSAAVKEIRPKLLSRIKANPNLTAGIDWALYEFLDNAGVHGYKCYDRVDYPLPVYTCAFSYKDRIELVVLDRGQGIYNSLKDKIQCARRDVLNEATKKGVTGHPEGSAGFGLFGASELARKGAGKLHIWSDDYGLSMSADRTKQFSIPEFGGTMISLGLSAGAKFALESIITRTADEYLADTDDLEM